MTQVGRSMVEMLGVLVIMALLGIGAIKIYHNFINKTKIQNTAKEIQTLVLERQNSAISLTTGGRRHVEAAHCNLYLENGTEGKFANYFWIDTTLNNEDFCSGLKKSDLINAKVIEGVCPGKLTFYFKKSPNVFVEDGIYVDTNGNKHFCPEHVIACDDENTATACEDGYYVNDASCLPCPEPTCTIICSEEEVYNPSLNACVPICHQNSDCGECEHCGESGFCEGCETGETCAAKFEDPETKKCCAPTNLVEGLCCRFPDGNGGCNECEQNSDCTDNDTPYCNRGMCEKCEEGKILATNGKCYDCITGGDNITVLKENCTRMCPNRIYASTDSSTQGYCSLPCGQDEMRASDGQCYPCNHQTYLYSNSEVCLTYCPKKIYVGSTCRVKQGDCKEDYVLQDSFDGSCLKCDGIGVIQSSRVREKNCVSSCGELREIATYTGTNGQKTTSCALKVCPVNAPIRKSDGGCGECGKSVAYVISEDECYRCPNSLALVDGSNRTYCHACPAKPTYNDVKNNPRGCEHCGFQWDKTTNSCVNK